MTDDERDAHTAPTPESWPEQKARPAALWQAGRVGLGVALIVLGVIGCLLPIVPGIPFLIAGVALLGPKHWLVRPLADRLARWRKRGGTPSGV